ncbi:hypothetical protein [Sulfitobacter sp. R18_1]|uniref:hypothetical protein n=1 Tax=Sulfitobacter sp. R18_1 TaxID=2821104 RepID=UPI001ADCEEAC|nr:hypothetical protein [Sulfitobacter sp. R18_1]MBO9428312.1 hypothetical protein [Sulfitobacter sp. R18_1]
MKVAVVSSSSLGVNCWSAARFNNGCHTCSRYESCKYPERVANQEYDQVLEDAREAKKKADALYEKARDMRGGRA